MYARLIMIICFWKMYTLFFSSSKIIEFDWFTHFCREVFVVRIYALFPQIFFSLKNEIRKLSCFLDVCALCINWSKIRLKIIVKGLSSARYAMPSNVKCLPQKSKCCHLGGCQMCLPKTINLLPWLSTRPLPRKRGASQD